MPRLPKPPGFPCWPPKAYQWLVERGLVGFTSFSPLQPWYFLDEESAFDVTQEWPDGPWQEGNLIAFARRQDSDDIACFNVENDRLSIVEVHAWTSSGYKVVATYTSFWEWLKAIIDDISTFVDPDEAADAEVR